MMFNVCPNCGLYSVEKQIEPSGPLAIRPRWHYTHLFNTWLIENAARTDPPKALVDTGRCSVVESVRHTVNWIRERL